MPLTSQLKLLLSSSKQREAWRQFSTKQMSGTNI